MSCCQNDALGGGEGLRDVLRPSLALPEEAILVTQFLERCFTDYVSVPAHAVGVLADQFEPACSVDQCKTLVGIGPLGVLEQHYIAGRR